MNYLLKFVAILFIAVSPFHLSGQSKKDPKAHEILKGVSNKYKSSKTVSASFRVITTDQKSKSTDTQTGSILIKGDKYKLTLKGQEIVSDGKTVWTYLKESKEIHVNDVNTRSDAISPTTIFTIYEKGFSSKYTGESTYNNIPVQQIELVPDDSKKPYFKIQLNINKSEKIIASAKIFEKGGTHITYSVDQFKLNQDVADNTFNFDPSKYPGAEVIDLR
jgi:outer membrane lipoprotein-sorting protein